MSIVLHIERLVLDEALLAGEGAGQMRHAIERELAAVLAGPGMAETLRKVGTVAATPTTDLPKATGVRSSLAVRVASAVNHSLSRSADRGSHG